MKNGFKGKHNICGYSCTTVEGLQVIGSRGNKELSHTMSKLQSWSVIAYVFALKGEERYVIENKRSFKGVRLNDMTNTVKHMVQEILLGDVKGTEQSGAVYISAGYIVEPSMFGVSPHNVDLCLRAMKKHGCFDPESSKIGKAVYPNNLLNDIYMDDVYTDSLVTA